MLGWVGRRGSIFLQTGTVSLLSPLKIRGFPRSSVGKESAYNAGDPGSIPGLGRCPGEGNGNPLQYSCLEILMDRGTWQATVHGVTRVRHDLATEPPTPQKICLSSSLDYSGGGGQKSLKLIKLYKLLGYHIGKGFPKSKV